MLFQKRLRRRALRASTQGRFFQASAPLFGSRAGRGMEPMTAHHVRASPPISETLLFVLACLYNEPSFRFLLLLFLFSRNPPVRASGLG